MESTRLQLDLMTRETVLAEIAALSAEARAQVSADWLAKLHASSPQDPWVHGFRIMLRDGAAAIGRCGFKGPPADGAVEIAYGIDEEYRNRGFATEAAATLVAFAFNDPRVCVVRAHTLRENNASTRVLTKCGFHKVGEVVDPEDGLVWRWEKSHA